MRGARPGLVRGLALLALAVLLVGRAWQRWGPVPEAEVPPGALVRQWSPTTCGPAAVATLLNVHGLAWTPEGLEAACGVDESGASLYNLREALRGRGLEAHGFRVTGPGGLPRVPRPYIAHLAAGHFVVVLRLRRGKLEVFDPTSGTISRQTPRQLYDGGAFWVLAAVPRRP